MADNTTVRRTPRAQMPVGARLPVEWAEGAKGIAATGHAPAEVVILFTDAGGGHRSAARSLAEAMEGRANVTLLNLLDDHTPFPFNHFSMGYGPCVNYAPKLYSLIYHVTESRKPVMLGERYCYPLVRRSLYSALAASCPDLVISVHPLLTGLPLRVLRETGSSAPFVTVVTDPVTIHPAWLCPGVDLCVVATEEARAQAISSGMDPARVRVIGLPVRRAFAVSQLPAKSAARARLSLDPYLPLILLTGGGAGIGKVSLLARSIARRLAAAHVPAQMAIIAGRNRELLRQLRATPWPIPVTPLGFVEAMADWLAASDLLISKAGPGTLAEAACMGVPALVTSFIPGQEEGNVAWIEREGAGAYVRGTGPVASQVVEWLTPGNPTLGRMAVCARAIARPHAAADIAHAALGLVRTGILAANEGIVSVPYPRIPAA